ncbi:MAG: right-handed parallel beta-helix repeat-containing protein [Solirubrobacterales bacterium]
MANLTVGSGKQYSTLTAAVAASHDGDTIYLDAGTYTANDLQINTKISIVGVGGMAKLVSSQTLQKAILVSNTDLTLDHIEFTGAKSGGMNGAGIRYQGGNLVVKNSYFHDNQDGILGADSTGTVTITNSEFAHNGAGDGYSHNIYINHVASFYVGNSYFHDAVNGNQIKSRALKTVIENTRIDDGSNSGIYSIDLPNGGNAIVRNNTIVQGTNISNKNIIHFGGENGMNSNLSLDVYGNTIVNKYSGGGTALLNQTSTPVTFHDNKLYGSMSVLSGAGSTSNNTTLSSSPSMDTSHPWDATTTTPTPTTDPVPAPTPTPTDSGSTTPTATKTGTDGNDTLSGVGGEYKLVGGLGSDTYIVDSKGDVVVENSGGGNDLVKASVSHVMGDYTEQLQLTGLNAIDGTGNGKDNPITGNDAANTLKGMGGNDLIKGMGGNDVLIGGTGSDNLTGGLGADKFQYVSATDGAYMAVNATKGTLRGDTITDFTSGTDKIALAASALGLNANGLTVGKDLVFLSTEFNGTNAKAASEFNLKHSTVIVDSTGTIYVDKNGADAGYTVLATVQSGAKIAATDISVYYDLG